MNKKKVLKLIPILYLVIVMLSGCDILRGEGKAVVHDDGTVDLHIEGLCKSSIKSDYNVIRTVVYDGIEYNVLKEEDRTININENQDKVPDGDIVTSDKFYVHPYPYTNTDYLVQKSGKSKTIIDGTFISCTVTMPKKILQTNGELLDDYSVRFTTYSDKVKEEDIWYCSCIKDDNYIEPTLEASSVPTIGISTPNGTKPTSNSSLIPSGVPTVANSSVPTVGGNTPNISSTPNTPDGVSTPNISSTLNESGVIPTEDVNDNTSLPVRSGRPANSGKAVIQTSKPNTTESNVSNYIATEKPEVAEEIVPVDESSESPIVDETPDIKDVFATASPQMVVNPPVTPEPSINTHVDDNRSKGFFDEPLVDGNITIKSGTKLKLSKLTYKQKKLVGVSFDSSDVTIKFKNKQYKAKCAKNGKFVVKLKKKSKGAFTIKITKKGYYAVFRRYKLTKNKKIKRVM